MSRKRTRIQPGRIVLTFPRPFALRRVIFDAPATGVSSLWQWRTNPEFYDPFSRCRTNRLAMSRKAGGDLVTVTTLNRGTSRCRKSQGSARTDLDCHSLIGTSTLFEGPFTCVNVHCVQMGQNFRAPKLLLAWRKDLPQVRSCLRYSSAS